jgi:hypothetical protein
MEEKPGKDSEKGTWSADSELLVITHSFRHSLASGTGDIR